MQSPSKPRRRKKCHPRIMQKAIKRQLRINTRTQTPLLFHRKPGLTTPNGHLNNTTHAFARAPPTPWGDARCKSSDKAEDRSRSQASRYLLNLQPPGPPQGQTLPPPPRTPTKGSPRPSYLVTPLRRKNQRKHVMVQVGAHCVVILFRENNDLNIDLCREL